MTDTQFPSGPVAICTYLDPSTTFDANDFSLLERHCDLGSMMPGTAAFSSVPLASLSVPLWPFRLHLPKAVF